MARPTAKEANIAPFRSVSETGAREAQAKTPLRAATQIGVRLAILVFCAVSWWFLAIALSALG